MCLQAVPLNPENPCTWILEFRMVSALFHLDGFIPLPPRDPPGPMKRVLERLGAAGWVQPSKVHKASFIITTPLWFCFLWLCHGQMSSPTLFSWGVVSVSGLQLSGRATGWEAELWELPSILMWSVLCHWLKPQEKLSGWESCGTNVIPCRGELPRGGC